MSTLVEEPGTETVVVRTLRESDIPEVVRIDAAATGRSRPRYFELLLLRSIHYAGLRVSLVAEVEGRIVGHLIGSLYYGEYGITEPTASIDAVAVDPAERRHHVGRAMLRQFRANVAARGVTSIRTEVAWKQFDLMSFLQSEGFAPAQRLCLEVPVDPTLTT